MKFSEKLILLRKRRNLTQEEFAQAVGVSRQSVYKWESGQSYPEAMKLVEIKALFGVSIDDLLDEAVVTFDRTAVEEKKPCRRENAPEKRQEEQSEPAVPDQAPVAATLAASEKQPEKGQGSLSAKATENRQEKEPEKAQEPSPVLRTAVGKPKKKQTGLMGLLGSFIRQKK